MTNSGHSNEEPGATSEGDEQWNKASGNMHSATIHDASSSSIGVRIFAIVLLLLALPLLLLVGSCGAIGSASSKIFGPISLAISVGLAFISFKGVRALWRGDWSGVFWVLGLVLLALVSGMSAIWIGKHWAQPLFLHN